MKIQKAGIRRDVASQPHRGVATQVAEGRDCVTEARFGAREGEDDRGVATQNALDAQVVIAERRPIALRRRGPRGAIVVLPRRLGLHRPDTIRWSGTSGRTTESEDKKGGERDAA